MRIKNQIIKFTEKCQLTHYALNRHYCIKVMIFKKMIATLIYRFNQSFHRTTNMTGLYQIILI